jgi:hypothetical protein
MSSCPRQSPTSHVMERSHLLSAADVNAWFGEHAGDAVCRATAVRDPAMLWFSDAVAEGLPTLRSLNPLERRKRVLLDCSWHAEPAGWLDNHGPTSAQLGIADRYGGVGIGKNGGSGRAWYVAGYHVKGIGRTPLIGHGVNAAHASGGAYLEEIVRETIFTELHRLEFPCGAVPMLAIIDLGVDVVWKTTNGDKRERQVLAVRPAMLRPAHFERALQHASSIPFGGAVDAERVVTRIGKLCDWLPSASIEAALRTWATGWAEQIGYGYVHRLAHGGLSTSNVTWSGALFDFGACSAMPDWRRYLLNDDGRRFEPSSDIVTAGLESLVTSWYFATDTLPVPRETLRGIACDAQVALARRVLIEARRLVGDLPSQASAAVAGLDDAACLRGLSVMAAARSSLHAFPSPGDHQGEDWLDTVPDFIAEVFALSESPRLTQIAPLVADTQSARARFIARPRPALHREAMHERLYAAVDRPDDLGRIDPEAVTRFIATEVARHRRDPGEIPDDAEAVGFVHGHAGSGTLIRRAASLWLSMDLPCRPAHTSGELPPERHWCAVEEAGPMAIRLKDRQEPVDVIAVLHDAR